MQRQPGTLFQADARDTAKPPRSERMKGQGSSELGGGGGTRRSQRPGCARPWAPSSPPRTWEAPRAPAGWREPDRRFCWMHVDAGPLSESWGFHLARLLYQHGCRGPSCLPASVSPAVYNEEAIPILLHRTKLPHLVVGWGNHVFGVSWDSSNLCHFAQLHGPQHLPSLLKVSQFGHSVVRPP